MSGWWILGSLDSCGSFSESETNYFSELTRIDGKLIEFEWKIFPGCTTAGILNEIQKMMGELQCDPADFKDRIIFMLTFNDIVWDARGNDELCENNSKSVAEYARQFLRGHWSFLELGSEQKRYGTCAHFPCRTRIFLTHSLSGVQTSRTRVAQGVCSAHVIPLPLTLSIFSCFISLVCCSRTVTLTLRSRLYLPCPNCSRSESAGPAHFRTSGQEFGYLADPAHSTGYEPKEFDMNTSADETRRLSTIRTTITSLTSRKSHAGTLECSLFPQC